MTVVLFTMRANEGDEFQFNMHMSSAESADEGGPKRGVCELWMQRMCFQ